MESFSIEPDGSPDSWNKQTCIQRAMARLQVFRGDPAINQDQLKKDVLTADDPRLIKSVFIGQDISQQLDGMQQALKILLLQEGYPVPVTASDDHLVAIQIDLGWLQKQGHTGEPVDPIALQRVHQDISQHFQFLKQQNPAAAKQIQQLIQQAEQMPTAANTATELQPRPAASAADANARGLNQPTETQGPALMPVATPIIGGARVLASPDIPGGSALPTPNAPPISKQTPHSPLITPNSAFPSALRTRNSKVRTLAKLTPGTIYKGHRYLGGAPSKRSSWQKLRQPK